MSASEGGWAEATEHQWRALALGVLRKMGRADDEAAIDRLLSSTTDDGVTLAPLYPAAPATAPRLTRDYRGWDVRSLHRDPDAGRVNEAVHADLAAGVTSVWLDGVDDLATALAGVDLATVAVVGSPGLLSLGAPVGNLAVDPLGWSAHRGEPVDLTPAAELAVRCAGAGTGLRAITVDATVYHDAGGSDGEELGAALAAGVAYLRALTDAGLDVATAAGQLEFRFAATADQFATIAKLRAARRLWARVLEASGAAGVPQQQHAVTSAAMMTRRDPWVNLLRTTVAAFAAGVGGADAVTVLPFDHALGLPDALGRRLARNTQSLLLAEAHVAAVVDPAGGSGFVERLTDALVGVAWDWFTAIERAGGLPSASGLVAERLATTWARRERDLRARVKPLTGVSEFPDLAERPLTRPAAPAQPSGGLPRHRYAEAFEALRDAADDAAEGVGRRPSVFLATLGPVAAHTARAGFATNLLAAGGVGVVPGPVSSDPAEIAAAFTASGLTVACVAGTDRAYADSGAAVAGALDAAGAGAVWLAGPGPVEGVTHYLHAGVDAIAVLSTVHDQLGVSA